MKLIFIGLFLLALLAGILGKYSQGEGSWFGDFLNSSGIKHNENEYKSKMEDLKPDDKSDELRDTRDRVRELNDRVKDQMQRLKDQRSR